MLGRQEILMISDTREKLSKADNRKLAWLLLNCTFIPNLIAFSTDDIIIDEVVKRLYPEYDGEKVQLTNFGWKTPTEEIRYI